MEPVPEYRKSFPIFQSAKVLVIMNVQVSADATFAPAEHLEMQLQRRLGSRVRELRVLVRHDGVVLKGWASTYHAKQLAQHAAMELADKRVLANDIEVR
jgi:cell wall assembly regulator SMI1